MVNFLWRNRNNTVVAGNWDEVTQEDDIKVPNWYIRSRLSKMSPPGWGCRWTKEAFRLSLPAVKRSTI
jgi:hypothetical protein